MQKPGNMTQEQFDNLEPFDIFQLERFGNILPERHIYYQDSDERNSIQKFYDEQVSFMPESLVHDNS